MDLSINVAQLLPLFQSIPDPASDGSDDDVGEEEVNLPKSNKRRQGQMEHEVPNAQFAYISYVRVYANCRLRRVWLVGSCFSYFT